MLESKDEILEIVEEGYTVISDGLHVQFLSFSFGSAIILSENGGKSPE